MAKITRAPVPPSDLKPTLKLLEELIYEVKTTRHGLVLTGMAADISEPVLN